MIIAPTQNACSVAHVCFVENLQITPRIFQKDTVTIAPGPGWCWHPCFPCSHPGRCGCLLLPPPSAKVPSTTQIDVSPPDVLRDAVESMVKKVTCFSYSLCHHCRLSVPTCYASLSLHPCPHDRCVDFLLPQSNSYGSDLRMNLYTQCFSVLAHQSRGTSRLV